MVLGPFTQGNKEHGTTKIRQDKFDDYNVLIEICYVWLNLDLGLHIRVYKLKLSVFWWQILMYNAIVQ